MEILVFITGLTIGGIVGYLFMKGKSSSGLSTVSQQVESLQERIIEHKEQASKLETKIEADAQEILSLTRALTQKESEQKNLLEKVSEQKSELLEIQKRLTNDFKNLANEIFEEKSKKFTDLNKVNIGDLLKPLGEKIGTFEKKVEEANKENIARNSALREQLINLKELNVQVTKEAENLTKALKGDSKSQGNWGEVILERILEKSGLEKGREYLVQESFTSEEGRRLQPDIIIQLPDDKNIIIDSKVTLTAYERFSSAADENESAIQLKAHIQSLRAHIKNLNAKNYQNLYGVKGLDFVLMFIPIEPAFSLGVQNDGELFNDAYERNIVMVSPSTLIATLRTISNIWKNEYQNQNSQEIARQGGDLYDKFVGFTEDLLTLGKQLDTTQRTYGEAMKKLVDGKGNLVTRAEKIRKLGAIPSKSLDKRLVERGEED